MSIQNLIFSLFLVFIFNINLKAENKNINDIYITIGSDAVDQSFKSMSGVEVISSNNKVSLVKLNKNDIPLLSHIMHEKFHRCGGFMAHNNKKEAFDFLNNQSDMNLAAKGIFTDYTISNPDEVRFLINQVTPLAIEQTIKKLSSYHNRYYKSETGVQSSNWIKSKWEDMSNGRADIKVESFSHRQWPQPSIIMTIEGESDETIVIGGHADSIAGYWGGSSARAPGADDNASGIATITEVIRVLMQSSYKPEKTIKFMAYAAEEVGLLGSKEIARDFRSKGINVIGVMQLDMTNFKGSSDKDIVMMTDYTNSEQNAFLGRLIDEYLQIPWGYDRCGYGCSDHASWHSVGYPASIPFEAKKGDMNRAIHTNRDTISLSRGNANHAAKFAKLGLAYLVELDK